MRESRSPEGDLSHWMIGAVAVFALLLTVAWVGALVALVSLLWGIL